WPARLLRCLVLRWRLYLSRCRLVRPSLGRVFRAGFAAVGDGPAPRGFDRDTPPAKQEWSGRQTPAVWGLTGWLRLTRRCGPAAVPRCADQACRVLRPGVLGFLPGRERDQPLRVCRAEPGCWWRQVDRACLAG